MCPSLVISALSVSLHESMGSNMTNDPYTHTPSLIQTLTLRVNETPVIRCVPEALLDPMVSQGLMSGFMAFIRADHTAKNTCAYFK